MSHLKRAREAKARNVIERFPEYFTLPSCLTHNSCRHLQAADNEDTSSDRSKVLSLIACNDNCNVPFVPPLVDAGASSSPLLMQVQVQEVRQAKSIKKVRRQEQNGRKFVQSGCVGSRAKSTSRDEK